MTPRFFVEHFEATGVLHPAPRGAGFDLITADGEDWGLALRKFAKPRRYLGLKLTVIGPRCGARVIEVLQLYIHDAQGGGHWVI